MNISVDRSAVETCLQFCFYPFVQRRVRGLYERRAELDGLRGLAILLVLLWHYVAVPLKGAKMGTRPSDLSHALGLTWSGVDLFFVLSGYLIGGILLDNKGSNNYLRTFYARRICRIFPLYLVLLSLFFVLLASPMSPRILGGSLGWVFEDPLPFWSYLTFTQNVVMAERGMFGSNWLSATWSLAVEEHFYLVLPLLIWAVPRRRLPYLFIALILLVLPLRVATLYYFPERGQLASYVLMALRADALLLGVLCAWMMRDERVSKHLHRHTGALYALLTVLVTSGFSLLAFRSYAFSAPNYFHLALQPGSVPMTYVGYTWLALIYSCVLILAVTEKRGVVTFVVKNRALGTLGIIAFGVYLFHLPVLGSLHGIVLGRPPQLQNGTGILITVVAFALTLALAGISWLLLEKRVVNWGRRSFRYEDSAGAQAVAERHP